MTEHIPGPWHVNKFNDTKSWSIYAHDGSKSLASVRDEANARLIAAAPDLLAALKSAEELIGFWVRSRMPDWDGSVTAESELGKIRAAIAKAEGRS